MLAPQARRSVFGIPELDVLLPTPTPPPPQAHPSPQQNPHVPHNDDEAWDPDADVDAHPSSPPAQYPVHAAPPTIPKGPPISHVLELVSPPATHHASSAGKSSLVYLIITHAVLPPVFSGIPLDGHAAAVVLIDPLRHFSAARLAQVMLQHIAAAFKQHGKKNLFTTADTKREVLTLIKRSLTHLHILHPPTWDALLANLRSLPDYLFDTQRHQSMHRRIHSIIIEDLSIFAFPLRSAHTGASNPLTTASARLTSALSRLATQLSCAVVVTGVSATPTAYRPPLPTSWPQALSVTRLAVRRVEVRRFAPGVSVEEAEAGREQRWEVVSRGRFVCSRVVGGGRMEGEEFVFRVGDGVEVERGEG